MALFQYKAAGLDGGGKRRAGGARQATAVEAPEMGFIPIRIEPLVAAGESGGGLFSRRRIGQDQVGGLTRELATLLRSGLPLDRAVEILISLAQSPPMQVLLLRVRDEVRGGAAFSKALEAHPGVFSSFYVGMVRAGEASGALGPVLARIGEFMERSQELKETVKSALIYPSILVLASVTSVMLLLIFVVPQFSQMFEQSGKALPLATQIVIRAGDLLRGYWWAIPLRLFAVYRYFAAHTQWGGRKQIRLGWPPAAPALAATC
jgi:general secretion pathway protein F